MLRRLPPVLDLVAAREDREAADRIVAHGRAAGDTGLLEARDFGAGSVYATIPKWATDDAAPRSIAAAPLVNILRRPLPSRSGLDLRLVRLTTPPVAAIQTALNAAVVENDPVDGFATAPVQTSATRVDAAIQLLEQGRQAIDATLLPAIVEAVDSAIGSAFLNALTTLTGAGAATATYVDATTTLVEFWAALEPLIRTTQGARKVGGRPLVVVHPRRLSWIRGRIVAENLAGFDLGPPVTPGATLSAFGGSLDIVSDPTVTITNGVNEDVVYVLPAPDVVDLFLGPVTVWVNMAGASTLSGNLTVSIFGRREVAFASRMAGAVGVLTGTGLVTP